MQVLAFILGRKPLLSIAELTRVLPPKSHIIDLCNDALIAVIETPLSDPQASLNRLGGSIKIVEVFNEDLHSPAEIASCTSTYLIEKFKGQSSKLIYGLSAYNFSDRHETILRKSLISIKKELVAAGMKSRFINKNFQNLENAAINGEKLVTSGAEIVVIKGTRKMYLGQTIALQDFENYSERDFDRPERDAKIGMLPPKLAQIMINLAGFSHLDHESNPTQTIYDPFAGLGTVLTESMLMGYSILGSDIDSKVLSRCEKNINWIRNDNYDINQHIRLFTSDATKLEKKMIPEDITAVVTESYLGPPIYKVLYPDQMQSNFQIIGEMNLKFFETLKNIIKPGTPVIIAFPVYRDGHKNICMPGIAERIGALGYEIEHLVPGDVVSKFAFPAGKSPGLIYDRPDQFVGREIYKFLLK